MAAGSTYTKIASTTLGSAAASVTFSSIPGTYTDLILVIEGQYASGAGSAVALQYNGDTGTNYSNTFMYGSTSANSGRNTAVTSAQLGFMSGAQISNSIMQIQNYSNTTTYKSGLGRGNVTGDIVYAVVGLWRNTAAINSIAIKVDSGVSYASGCTFNLYGIAAA
jgi:hypothetical protein